MEQTNLFDDAGPAPVPAPFDLLTPQELCVARGIAAGLKTSEIAEALGIARKTADTHRAKMIKKLHGAVCPVRHSVDVARLAYRTGLATP